MYTYNLNSEENSVGPDSRQNHLPQILDEIVQTFVRCQLNRKKIERKNRKSRSSNITYRSRKFDLICILAVALFPVLVTLQDDKDIS